MALKIDEESIAALDLSAIKLKLMHESGEAWSSARAGAVEVEYRRFLYLAKKYPDKQTAPSVDVDTFWHHHILDTKKYASDCADVFGYFLHHNPYFGIGEASDETARQDGAQLMRDLYEQTFGERYMSAATQAAQPAYCTLGQQPALLSFASQPAYCTRGDSETAVRSNAPQASYCTLSREASGGCETPQAAYCTFASETGSRPLTAQQAYCTFARETNAPPRAAQQAYCTFAQETNAPSRAAQQSYCTFGAGTDVRSLSTQQAYCTFVAASSAHSPAAPPPH